MGILEDYVSALQKVPLNEAIPGGAGTTPQGDPTMFSNMITSALSIPQRAVEAAKQDTAHYQQYGMDQNYAPQTVAPAAEAAMTLAGVGAPAAEAGAAGIFGGKMAATADLKALNEAQQMAAAGIHPEDIWQSTGWFQHPADSKWRFEIPDNRSVLQYQAGNPRSLDRSILAGPAPEMLRHPDLYKAYPELRHVRMESRHDTGLTTGAGSFDPNIGHLGGIDIAAPDLYNGRSVALHELQHAIQNIEGFHPGTSEETMRVFQKQYPQYLSGKGQHSSDPYDLYHRIAGEVEARNVQTRRDFEPSRRMLEHPILTQDVPLSNTIGFTGMEFNGIDPILLDVLRNK